MFVGAPRFNGRSGRDAAWYRAASSREVGVSEQDFRRLEHLGLGFLAAGFNRAFASDPNLPAAALTPGCKAEQH